MLDVTKETVRRYREELEQLRQDTAQHEDAINVMIRQVEVTRREKHAIELKWQYYNSEHENELESFQHVSALMNALESDLQQRIAEHTILHNNKDDHIVMLKATEDVIKMKDQELLKIQNEVQTLQRQIELMRLLPGMNKQDEAANQNAKAQQTKDNAAPQTATSASAATVEGAAAPAVPAAAAGGAAPQPAADAASSSGAAVASDANPMSAESRNALMNSIAKYTGEMSQLEMQVQALKNEQDVLLEHVRVSERERDSLIDRLTKQRTDREEIAFQLKHARQRNEESDIAIAALRGQLSLMHTKHSDQLFTLQAYEERMKHFQQLLMNSDVRVDLANSAMSDILKQVTVYKAGNAQLQQTLTLVKREFVTVSRHRNQLMDQLSEKYLAWADSQPATSAAIDKQAVKLRHHYKQITESNNSLQLENANLREEVNKLKQMTATHVPRAEYEADLQSLHVELDNARAQAKQHWDASAEATMEAKNSEQKRMQLQNELDLIIEQRLQQEQQQNNKATEEQLQATRQASQDAMAQAKQPAPATKTEDAETKAAQATAQNATNNVATSGATQPRALSPTSEVGIANKKRKLEETAQTSTGVQPPGAQASADANMTSS